jgi:hypothetical protein
MSYLDDYDKVRKEQAKVQGIEDPRYDSDASDASNNSDSDASFDSDAINLEKKFIMKYKTNDISGYTIKSDILCMKFYKKKYIQFENKCIYVVVYIPYSTIDNIDIVENTIFQLFTSDEMNNNKVMYNPFTPYKSYNDEISVLQFENTVSFQSIMVQTMEYIKFTIKTINIKQLNFNMTSLNALEFDLYGENHYDFDDDKLQYIEENIVSYIDHKKNSIQNKKQVLLDCEKEFIVEESDGELNLVSHCAFEIDNTRDKLYVKNIDLEKIEKEHILESKMECIKLTELYLDELIIPDINENNTYKINEEILQTLYYDCVVNIKNLSVFAEDDKSDKLGELIALLESKKLLIDAKMTELENMSSVLLAKDARNARLVSLRATINVLLEQEHDSNDYKIFDYEFISKYYLGYKNMIKTIKNENINELLDKIPLLEAKQKMEEEKENQDLEK